MNCYMCFHMYVCSYSMMMSCWNESPDQRPLFEELVNTITTILAPLGDYMDFSDAYCKAEKNTKDTSK